MNAYTGQSADLRLFVSVFSNSAAGVLTRSTSCEPQNLFFRAATRDTR